jgi:hypothetical protein
MYGILRIGISVWKTCDVQSVNSFNGLLEGKACDPFFFAESTITGLMYQDMLELCAWLH